MKISKLLSCLRPTTSDQGAASSSTIRQAQARSTGPEGLSSRRSDHALPEIFRHNASRSKDFSDLPLDMLETHVAPQLSFSEISAFGQASKGVRTALGLEKGVQTCDEISKRPLETIEDFDAALKDIRSLPAAAQLLPTIMLADALGGPPTLWTRRGVLGRFDRPDKFRLNDSAKIPDAFRMVKDHIMQMSSVHRADPLLKLTGMLNSPSGTVHPLPATDWLPAFEQVLAGLDSLPGQAQSAASGSDAAPAQRAEQQRQMQKADITKTVAECLGNRVAFGSTSLTEGVLTPMNADVVSTAIQSLSTRIMQIPTPMRPDPLLQLTKALDSTRLANPMSSNEWTAAFQQVVACLPSDNSVAAPDKKGEIVDTLAKVLSERAVDNRVEPMRLEDTLTAVESLMPHIQSLRGHEQRSPVQRLSDVTARIRNLLP